MSRFQSIIAAPSAAARPRRTRVCNIFLNPKISEKRHISPSIVNMIRVFNAGLGYNGFESRAPEANIISRKVFTEGSEMLRKKSG